MQLTELPVSPLASSMMAPALPQIAEHFNITNPTLVAMTLSIFLLSFAIGPLILGPLSEMYGRTWVCLLCKCWRRCIAQSSGLTDLPCFEPPVHRLQPRMCFRANIRRADCPSFLQCAYFSRLFGVYADGRHVQAASLAVPESRSAVEA